jgi:hypothetical protein
MLLINHHNAINAFGIYLVLRVYSELFRLSMTHMSDGTKKVKSEF